MNDDERELSSSSDSNSSNFNSPCVTPKTPNNRKRKKSESSGDEGWQRPDKCSKCSEVFSHDPNKWNKHNIEKHINSHYAKALFGLTHTVNRLK